MPTKKQITANRLNAKKSTGPRSNAGKTQAALNSRKHGFAASTFTVVRLEEPKAVDNLREDAIAFYQPINSQELFAVERIAFCQLALLRISRLECGMLTECLDEAYFLEDVPMQLLHPDVTGDGYLGTTNAQKCNFILANGFRKNTATPHRWELFLRYQTQTERQYRRAVEDFDRLAALRPEVDEPELEASPNEPNFAEPQSSERDAAIPSGGRAPRPAPDPQVRPSLPQENPVETGLTPTPTEGDPN